MSTLLWRQWRKNDLWYLIGLISADGCVSSSRRHIILVSKEREFLEQIQSYFRIHNKIALVNRNQKNQAYRLQLGSKSFCDFLCQIGITPKKSLIIHSVKIPASAFWSFLRGVIDGDGNIRKWQHPTAGTEQWCLRIYSGSPRFLIWLRHTIEKLFGVTGRIHAKHGKNDLVLKYGKLAAKVIFKICYRPGEIALARKFSLAQECIHVKSKWSKSVTLKRPSGEIGIHTGLKDGSP